MPKNKTSWDKSRHKNTKS